MVKYSETETTDTTAPKYKLQHLVRRAPTVWLNQAVLHQHQLFTKYVPLNDLLEVGL